MHVGDWLVLLAPKEEIKVLILNGRTTLLETRWPSISASAAERQGQSRLACTGARLLSTDKLAPTLGTTRAADALARGTSDLSVGLPCRPVRRRVSLPARRNPLCRPWASWYGCVRLSSV